MQEQVEVEIAGKKLSFSTGLLAKQSDGAVVVKLGDTMLLVTATSSKEVREGVDFLPLIVDYRENTYAAGKIPGGFFKREGKPTEREVTISRLIDRPIRPLFPKGYNYDTQIVASLLSYDRENEPDILGIIGASAALYISDIPFTIPIAAVRVGYINDSFVINPTNSELENSTLNLVVAGSKDGIVMVEAGATEESEEKFLEAFELAHKEIIKIIESIENLREKAGKPKREFEEEVLPEDKLKEVGAKIGEKLKEAINVEGKLNKEKAIKEVKKTFLEEYPEEEQEIWGKLFDEVKKEIFRRQVLDEGKRPDGRSFNEVRPLHIEVGLLPRVHGSALFQRGETQALVTTTLGTFEDIQRLDLLQGEDMKRFMLHYNFPPFCVGEVSPLRGPSRREIGHGALAERALLPAIPPEEDFPYTIRVVSDILESNGSSSMATVCGGCLSLMDAGVPLKYPVAGIAMGLIYESDDKYAILTDIAGLEDHYGDMDFKVAGSKNGITALQMDIKIKKVTRDILSKALAQAKEARLYVLEKMLQVLPGPREEISPHAPRIIILNVKPEKIKDLIGPSGRTIKNIIEKTGAKINIEQDGHVTIAADTREEAEAAKKAVIEVTQDAEVGRVYIGKVVRIEDYGAFVEILPNVVGLLHISEISNRRIRSVRDVLKEGQEVVVKVIAKDEFDRIKLSKKVLEDDYDEKQEDRRPHHNREHRDTRDRRKPHFHNRRRPPKKDEK